jgi:hypothetical protein
MSITTFERNASIAEMAVEMDRRGAVIEKLETALSDREAEIERLRKERDGHFHSMDAAVWRREYWQRRALKAEAERDAAIARAEELERGLRSLADAVGNMRNPQMAADVGLLILQLGGPIEHARSLLNRQEEKP